MHRKIGMAGLLLTASTLNVPAQMLSAIDPSAVVEPMAGGAVQSKSSAADLGALNENSWDFNDPRGVPGFGPMTIEDAKRAMAHIAQSAPPEVRRK
jgi:hypothetical protein